MSKPRMRAKMKVSSINSFESGETVTMQAVCANRYGKDGNDEDNTFAKYTPSAKIEITVTNPDLIGVYKPGDVFYVDFEPVEQS